MAYKLHKIIREKIAKKENQKQFWKVFFIEGGLFLSTSILAVVSAFELDKLIQAKKIYLPATSLQDFLFSFLLVTFFVLFFVLYKKAGKFKELIYKGLFIITVFWGGMTVLSLFIPTFGAILIMGILIMLWLEFPSVWVHDILIILGLAGAASFFGLELTPSVVVALLLIFSIYDFIAVYKTKHMILMAKEMIEKKVILGFIIPKNIKYFKDNFNKIKPGGNFMILGGGDVVFPSLLAVSVIPQGFLGALIIVLFSLVGIFFSYWLFAAQKGSEKHPQPIPALPAIALFAIIGYFITLLLL
jgi:presenilin-like A22 family membrane protease